MGESAAHRITLGYLTEHYGFDLQPAFASNVTITSLADDVASIRPGALFLAPATAGTELLERAQLHGAYAALLPHSLRAQTRDAEFPMLFAEPTAQQVGQLAADVSGSPSRALAVFAVCGEDADESRAAAVRLADFLHILGNPVAVLSSAGSSSLDRDLHPHYPLNILDVHHLLAVAAEDGAAAVVVSLDHDTLAHDALSGVGVDVAGVSGEDAETTTKADEQASRAATSFGVVPDDDMRVVTRTTESDALATQSSLVFSTEDTRRLSLAIAMVVAAGVGRNTIRSALRVSHEIR